jgi:peptidoglycan/LPS O-acetylase OafA/YrhL
MLKNIVHKKTYVMNLFVGLAWLSFSLFFLIANIQDELIPFIFFPAAFICLMLISAPLTAAHILKAKRTQKIEVIGLILNTILLIAFTALYTYVFTGNLSMQKKELAYILPFSFLLIGLPSAINVRVLRRNRFIRQA